MLFKINRHKIALALSVIIAAPLALADVQTADASYSYSQRALSTTGNAASAAWVIERKAPYVASGGMISVGGAIEYGDLDEIFEAIDDLAEDSQPLDPDEEPSNPSDGNSGESDTLIDWDKVFETYPDLESRLDLIKKEVVVAAALFSLIASEGYGKAELDSEASFVLNEDLWGGTLLMGASVNGSAKALGILEVPEFDLEAVKSQLLTLDSLTPDDSLKELDLTGGVTLYYNPSDNRAKVSIQNDSLLLVKSAIVNKFLFTYSKKALTSENGNLYWGVKPTYYNVGLNNIGVRLGDITDSEAIFNDIRNAEYQFSTGFDVDLGLTWAAENYQLGVSVNNLIETSFKYPEINTSSYTSESIINQLKANSEYVLERQVKLEGSVFSSDSGWSLNMGIDANAIQDPMKDEFQWFHTSADYGSDGWWMPSARVGFSHNLAGSNLSYVTAGATFMKYLNLDVSSALTNVTIDGTELMRGLDVNLGVQFSY